MRNAFFALVLANLAFAAWHTWFAPPPRPQRAQDPGPPNITLVSELPDDLRASRVAGSSAAPTDTATAAPDAPKAPDVRDAPPLSESTETPSPSPVATAADPAAVTAAISRCISVGPFRELSQAATAAANLRAAGYQPMQRVADGEIWIGYWVYIAGVPTTSAANEILAKVRDSGITDAYVIPNSDSGNLVSLGVFSEISGVSRRRDEVRALGYEPQVVDRTRRATVYWVDVVLTDGQTLDFDTLQAPGRIIRLEQRSCGTATD
jgi:cell division septation protein DedD